MHKNKPLLLLIMILSFATMSASFIHSQSVVILETTAGNIRIVLYDNTPKHKENFLKLVQQGFYDGLLFHRVIAGFMIQTGDPNSKNARPGQPLGNGGPNNTIPAEFYPEYFHKKGAVAAARRSDDVNPQKESSGSQFYLVQGHSYTSSQLTSLVETGKHQPFTAAQIEAYTTMGGVPHLDNAYTVFGEVIEGFEIIDSIASAKTDQRNRPESDIKILRAFISE